MTIWISREQIVARLKEAGYKFHDQNTVTATFRRGTDYVVVQKRDQLPDKMVVMVLRQAGLTRPEIDAFMTNCVKHSTT